jgi:hypothetical protein
MESGFEQITESPAEWSERRHFLEIIKYSNGKGTCQCGKAMV